MKRTVLTVSVLMLAVVLCVATGLIVNRAGDTRVEKLLAGADRLVAGEETELDDINRVRGNIAAGLDDQPCSRRVIRLTDRLLPERWKFNKADLANVRSGGSLAKIRLIDAKSPSAAKSLAC